MAISHQDVMEDLAYAESEGPADMLEDESDFADPYEDYAEGDAWDSGDMGDLYEDPGGKDADGQSAITRVLTIMLAKEY